MTLDAQTLYHYNQIAFSLQTLLGRLQTGTMEAYRSGHNELDSKSSCPQGHVGSNPTASATVRPKTLVVQGFSAFQKHNPRRKVYEFYYSKNSIIIVGNSGSSKSWLSKRIYARTEYPLFHLDKELWQPGWIMPPREEKIAKQQKM